MRYWLQYFLNPVWWDGNVEPIVPWVGVEVDVRELRMNVVDQFASGYNSSQSVALLLGVCSSSEAESGASARL